MQDLAEGMTMLIGDPRISFAEKVASRLIFIDKAGLQKMAIRRCDQKTRQ